MVGYPKLFQEGRIGNLVLKNRIIFPPMVNRYASESGNISERMLNYYYERSLGGCGLIVVEASYPRAGGYPGRIYLDKDEVIPDLRRLVKVIHEGGAKAVLQINPHRGRSDEVDPASASETVHPQTGVRARELSISDIEILTNEFGMGSRRAKEAGFDGIMIHGASGYIVSEFLSPRTNKRTDEYGGNIEGRARLALGLVAAAKENTASDFPIIFRLTADEKIEGGFGIDDAVVVSKLLEKSGVDAIDIVSGVMETFYWVIPYMYMADGCNAELSLAVKQAVKIPVCVAGNINDPNVAETILLEGKADFVDLGRALIADPHLPNKARKNKVENIRKCLSCCRCIESLVVPPVGPMICSVNPAVGRERQFELGMKPATEKKKVLVVGGGPGGLQAAITASLRGHDVTLWEKQDRIGGQLNLAAIPPGKERIKDLIEFLRVQVDKTKIKIELEMEANTERILEFSPDAAILALGAKPRIPYIEGQEKKKPMYFSEVLSGEASLGRKVVVIGGGYIGCEIADFLCSQGKEVCIRTSKAELANDLFYPYAVLMRERLKANGIEFFCNVVDDVIEDTGLRIRDKNGNKTLIEVDDIVLCTGFESDKTIGGALRGSIPKLYEVGDCLEPRRIHEAIFEGTQAGLGI